MSTVPVPLPDAPLGDVPTHSRLIAGLCEATNKVRRYVASRVRDPADAQDIVQESLARLLERARVTDIAQPEFYALTIARNLLNDRFRTARVAHAPLDDLLPCREPLPDRILCDRQRLALFRAALDAMPPLRREVFVRRRLEGESREAIAATLGLSPEAVKKHVTRALAQLARALADAEDAAVRQAERDGDDEG